MNQTRSLCLLLAAFICSSSMLWAEAVHFSGLYVPEGLSCSDGARISEEYGDLRAGYVIYDDEGRKSDDSSCEYDQVQALRGTAVQIVDLKCTFDGKSYTYRQLLSPLDSNRVLVINQVTEESSSFQVLTYCGWVPQK